MGNYPLKVLLSSLLIGSVVVSSIVAALYFSSQLHGIGPQASVESYPLSLSVGLDKTEFMLGENITVRCAIKNISNETITITFYAAYGYVDDNRVYHQVYCDFIVTDINGTEVYRWSQIQGALGTIYSITLNPNEERANNLLWWPPLLKEVPPGTYFVRARTPTTGTFQINNGPRISIESPSIKFIIKADT